MPNWPLNAYYLGVSIVLFSHLYILLYPNQPIMSMKNHCYLNIIAVFMIVYYFGYAYGQK